MKKEREEPIRSLDELIRYIEKSNSVEYLFFWGHQVKKSGTISKNCLSNWYPSEFIVDGIIYSTVEHFIMAQKAKLFGDIMIYKAILNAETPKEAKLLGREVTGFNDKTWSMYRMDIALSGLEAKFAQNKELKFFLLSTENRILVEASPHDKIWGIGMAEKNPEVENPKSWKGSNLLGFGLMEVRDRLRIKTFYGT